MKPASPVVIGWRERVDLPGLGLIGIIAKIDTGARTSALHASRVKLFDRDGQPWARFHVPHAGLPRAALCEAPVVDQRQITNTSGIPDERLVVQTQLVLGGRRWQIELSLADRGGMAAPIILGRTAIRRRRLLVDAGKSFLQSAKSARPAVRRALPSSEAGPATDTTGPGKEPR